MLEIMQTAMAPHLFWSITQGKCNAGRDLWRINPRSASVGYGTAISEAGAVHTLDAIIAAATKSARDVQWC